ncbi:helix-turn-helix domain-containing protein [Hymenobacter terricola]|uniref:helix-turn-helix domain-containing protein n=1 Tax=Hymenobacter terricola TaxID=2819236 RepID=UPI001B31714D|nr:helix-turn-helix transcriptional regulator [Hymenobacter terricola]
MKPFPELAKTRGYWLTKIQNELYACLEQYREKNKWTRTELAAHLGFSKGYLSQILNGEFDHKLSKLIDLSLAVGVAPNLHLQDLDTYVEDYLSGYDGCLRAEKVHISFHVPASSQSARVATTPSYFANSAKHLVDQDVSASYTTAPQLTAAYA